MFALFCFQKFFALFCFKAKRNKCLFASFHFTRYRLEKLKAWPNIFRFFTDCPRISLYPFSLWSFCFFFVCFRLIAFSFCFRCKNKWKNTFRIEAKKLISVSLHFTLKRKWRQFSLLFCLIFTLFHFRLASDFYVSHRRETSKKELFFTSKRKKFRFCFASFCFKARYQRFDIMLSPISSITGIGPSASLRITVIIPEFWVVAPHHS
jgi:hypothetical protein